jgi:flavorubredoxin
MSALRTLRAVVVFDTRHGNTARIAQGLSRGLASVPGLTAQVLSTEQAELRQLEEADLVVIGGPTEFLSASRHIKEFFKRIGGFNLSDKFGFAFDTHARSRASGSAAKYIEQALTNMHLTLLEPRQSALTELRPPAESNGDRLGLAAGTEEHFQEVGAALGRELHHAWEERRARPAELAGATDTAEMPRP